MKDGKAAQPSVPFARLSCLDDGNISGNAHRSAAKLGDIHCCVNAEETNRGSELAERDQYV